MNADKLTKLFIIPSYYLTIMLTSIHPKLPFRNKAVTRDFYLQKLGFRDIGISDFSDYLILEKDQVEIHFFAFPDLDPLQNDGQVYIRTRQIEKVYQSFLERGVEIHPHGILQPKPWGQREFSILDPDHNLLTFGEALSTAEAAPPFAQTYFHGTKARLKTGDLIETGKRSNYGNQKDARYIFLTSTLDAAVWGAELATGEGCERIYLVIPTGPIEDDPDLTDKKFPGNPTKSYRSTHPFRVVGEVTGWQGHAPEQVAAMLNHLQKLKDDGISSLNE